MKGPLIAIGLLIVGLVFAASPVAAASTTCNYAVVAGSGTPCSVYGSYTCNNPGFFCEVGVTCDADGDVEVFLTCATSPPTRIPSGTRISGFLGSCTPGGVATNVHVVCTSYILP